MANRLSISVISRRAGVAVYSRLSEDEIAEFLTETERKENKEYAKHITQYMLSTF